MDDALAGVVYELNRSSWGRLQTFPLLMLGSTVQWMKYAIGGECPPDKGDVSLCNLQRVGNAVTLSRFEKRKAQKLVDKIEHQEFDENDIDGLLLRLRDNAGKYGVFREVAHIAAHSGKRHAGLVRDNLRRFYLSMTHFQEYVSPKKTLDLSQPFPSYVWELMKYEIEKCDESDLRTKFRVSRKSLRNKLEKLFKYDKATRMCELRKPMPHLTFHAIKYLLGAIRSSPTLADHQIVDEFVGVLRANGLSFEESNFRVSTDRITLCVLLLLHNRTHSYGGTKSGHCLISCGNTGFPTGETSYPLEAIDKSRYESLQVNGTVTIDNKGKEVDVCFPVMTTSLPTSQWVDDSLFVLEDIAETLADDYEHWYVWKFDADADLYINDEFKLSRLTSE